jgi:hypothetical protein
MKLRIKMPSASGRRIAVNLPSDATLGALQGLVASEAFGANGVDVPSGEQVTLSLNKAVSCRVRGQPPSVADKGLRTKFC